MHRTGLTAMLLVQNRLHCNVVGSEPTSLQSCWFRTGLTAILLVQNDFTAILLVQNRLHCNVAGSEPTSLQCCWFRTDFTTMLLVQQWELSFEQVISTFEVIALLKLSALSSRCNGSQPLKTGNRESSLKCPNSPVTDGRLV